MERSLKNPNNFKYGRTSSLYLKQTIFQSFGGKHLWLISTSSLLCREKWLSLARDQGKVSTTKETENRGSGNTYGLFRPLVYFAARNDYLSQETKEKCQPRKKRKIEGRSATVPLHTHLL